MNRHTVITPAGVWICVFLALAGCVAAFLLFDVEPSNRNFGICLPSPNLWPLIPEAAWGINTALLFLTGISVSLLNKRYAFIKGTYSPVTPLLLLLCAFNMFLSRGLSAGMILLPASILSCKLLFDSYKSGNATTQMFIISSTLAIGSMFEYAFIPLMAAALVSAMLMGCLRIKELLAFLLGLVAPYWIAFGFGIVCPEDFHLPQLSKITPSDYATSRAFILFAGSAVWLVINLLLTLSNAVLLYAGNSKIRSENNVITIFGFTVALCMIFDFPNLLAYIGIFYFWTATQLANFFALSNLRKGWIPLILIIAAIISTGAAMLIF